MAEAGAARVLVVEDERIVALNLKHQLQKLGYQVIGPAASGDQALDRIDREAPDVVLMDIRIDGPQDGIDTAARIPADRFLPVVYLTAYADEATLSRARSTKPYGYLLKPFGDRELHATIQMALSRRDAEKALWEAEEYFRLALDAAEMGPWEFNGPSRTIRFSSQALRLLGAPADAVSLQLSQFLERVPEQERRLVEEWFVALPSKTERQAIEFRVAPLAGGMRWVALSGKTLAGTVRHENRTIGILRDVTRRRSVEDALRESEERHRSTVAALGEGVVLYDADGTVTMCNPAAARILGCAVSEIVGSRYLHTLEVLREDGTPMPRHEQASLAVLFTGYPVSNRLEGIKRRDGTVRWVSVNAEPLRWDQDKRPLAALASFTDVTELRSAEERLLQSQKLEAVGQLTGGVAHDFNNLLTVILGNAEMLRDQLKGNDQLRELAEMTHRAAQRGADLTERLLAFSRRQILQPRVVDLGQLVEGMGGLLRRTLGENVDIRIIRQANRWKALIDPAQLEAAVLNLCINARDAMPQGGKLVIEVSDANIDSHYARQHDKLTPGQYVLIAVTDNGTGMPPEVVRRVFEPFFTTKGPERGSGLGLSMVYGFVKQSGGHVNIYSEVGVGTSVKLYIPRAGAAEEQKSAPAVGTAAAQGSESILVVEDDELVAAYVGQQLQDLGYNVRVVRNGPEALAMLPLIPKLDLLFTDVIMPGGMNGKQLAEEALRLRPGLKVLFTSGYTEEAIIDHGRLERGVVLLQKPYSKLELAAKVREVLEAPRQESAGRGA